MCGQWVHISITISFIKRGFFRGTDCCKVKHVKESKFGGINILMKGQCPQHPLHGNRVKNEISFEILTIYLLRNYIFSYFIRFVTVEFVMGIIRFYLVNRTSFPQA